MSHRITLPSLLRKVRACDLCTEHLPLGPRPILQMASGAPLVIVGQAPGTKVHQSGVPWDDDSGNHLRQWLRLDAETFYDTQQVAILPMGFCYPGRKKGGDAPPRPECAPQWHQALLSHLAKDALILLVGQYAQNFYLKQQRKKTLGETVRACEEYLPRFFPLPHPSWRSKIWMSKNPWFERDTLPALRQQVNARLQGPAK